MFYPDPFLVESILAKRCVRTRGRILKYTNTNCEPSKPKGLVKGNLEEVPP